MDSSLKDANRMIVNAQWKKMELLYKKNNQVLIHETQNKVAKEIVYCFTVLNKSLVNLTAPVQWGKTGTILKTIYLMCSIENNDKIINYENVFIITGLSDNEWLSQTKDRLPKEWRDNVFHRNRFDFNTFKDKKDTLIIIDECHIASGEEQTITEVLKEAGILNIDYLLKNNIKILQTSATPDNLLIHSDGWGDAYEKINVSLPKTYVSFKDIKDDGRLFPTLNLYSELDLLIQLIETFKRPKYHLFRINSSHYDDHRSILERLSFEKNYQILIHDYTSKIKNAEKMLEIEPDKHTFILLKGMWRASKTFTDKNIGIVCESLASNKDFSSEVQGLPGRMCGHNKIRGKDGPLIFCKVEAIDEYINLINNGFQYKELDKWKTKNLIIKDKFISKCDECYVSPKLVDGASVVELPKKELKFKRDIDYKIELLNLSELLPKKSNETNKQYWNRIKKHFDLKNVHNPFKKEGFVESSILNTKKVFLKNELVNLLNNLPNTKGFNISKKHINVDSKIKKIYICYESDDSNNPIILCRVLTAIKECSF